MNICVHTYIGTAVGGCQQGLYAQIRKANQKQNKTKMNAKYRDLKKRPSAVLF